MKKFSLYLTPTQDEVLRLEAKAKEIKITDLMRQVLGKHVDKVKKIYKPEVKNDRN